MISPEAARRWWPVVKGWSAVAIFAGGMFAAGWSLGVLTVQHRADLAIGDAMAAKDALIAKLAGTTATASDAAAQATDQAAQAANAARAATTTAAQATDEAKAASAKSTQAAQTAQVAAAHAKAATADARALKSNVSEAMRAATNAERKP